MARPSTSSHAQLGHGIHSSSPWTLPTRRERPGTWFPEEDTRKMTCWRRQITQKMPAGNPIFVGQNEETSRCARTKWASPFVPGTARLRSASQSTWCGSMHRDNVNCVPPPQNGRQRTSLRVCTRTAVPRRLPGDPGSHGTGKACPGYTQARTPLATAGHGVTRGTNSRLVPRRG